MAHQARGPFSQGARSPLWSELGYWFLAFRLSWTTHFSSQVTIRSNPSRLNLFNNQRQSLTCRFFWFSKSSCGTIWPRFLVLPSSWTWRATAMWETSSFSESLRIVLLGSCSMARRGARFLITVGPPDRFLSLTCVLPERNLRSHFEQVCGVVEDSLSVVQMFRAASEAVCPSRNSCNISLQIFGRFFRLMWHFQKTIVNEK